MTEKNKLMAVVETLRDLLRSKINGQSGYNFRLTEDQVFRSSEHVGKVNKFPAVMLATVSEVLDQIVISDANPDFGVSFEIRILGIVQDADDPLGEAMKLYSDIQNAIRSDPFLTDSNGNELVYGTKLSSSCKEEGEWGFVECVFSAKYHREA